MIVSAIDGRIRIIELGLKNDSKADALEKSLQQVEGISSASVNRVIGSLLIHYDSSVTGFREIRNQVKQQLIRIGVRPGVRSFSGPNSRRHVKFGLLGSVFGIILFLILNSEKWHFLAGTAFISLLSMHLFQNRKRLLK